MPKGALNEACRRKLANAVFRAFTFETEPVFVFHPFLLYVDRVSKYLTEEGPICTRDGNDQSGSRR
jgi:hypothetical protein